MAISGQLTKAQFGYSVPVDAPLYEPFPLYYEDTTIMLFPYLTSATAAAALLPAQLSLAPVPDPTTGQPIEGVAAAEVVFAQYGFSNIGAYNEVAQTVQVLYNGPLPPGLEGLAGKPFSYAVRLHVTSDVAMAAGREIGGFPKKMGEISFEAGSPYFSALEAPKGLRICSGELNPYQKVFEQASLPPALATIPLDYLSLRVIPDPASLVQPYTPAVCELIYTQWVLSQGTMWGGRGALSFTGASALHPYHTLPILKQAPPWSPSTPAQPGTGLFRGRMGIGTVAVLQRF